MRWQMGRRSDNVEDRRGMGAGTMIAGGGIGTVVIALIAIFLGVDPRSVIQTAPAENPAATQSSPGAPDPQSEFVRAVLASTEDVWTKVFPEAFGKPYVDPKLVLFTDAVE